MPIRPLAKSLSPPTKFLTNSPPTSKKNYGKKIKHLLENITTMLTIVIGFKTSQQKNGKMMSNLIEENRTLTKELVNQLI